jgi:enamine deaminase RidA (YjgF/YER057c/UK114 family)
MSSAEEEGMDQVVLSRITGLYPDGTRPPTFPDEARQAWVNAGEALYCAGSGIGKIVHVRTWLVDAEDFETYAQVVGTRARASGTADDPGRGPACSDL